MQATRRARRDWTIALAASLLIHLLMLGYVRFAPVPSADVADDATPVAILHITKRVSFSHGRRGGSAAAPVASRSRPEHNAPAAPIARGAAAPGSTRALTAADARRAGARPAQSHARSASPAQSGRAGTAHETGETAKASAIPIDAESPGPAPTVTAEMLASLNQRMRDAIPSAAPKTIKLYPTDLRGLAMRPDTNRWTAANYPLPQRGLFAHALVVRIGHEAVAVRAIQRIGNAYICIGYLAKIDEHNPAATLAGPYVGPCKKAWREQLGLIPKQSPTPDSSATPAPNASPTTTPPAIN